MTGIPAGAARLELAPPPPGLPYLARRLGTYTSFLANLLDEVERTSVDGGTLGRAWDLRADPRVAVMARLWAFVAEGVAAYTELTANEAYLGTALEWTNVRRLADLLGYHPSPRIAAQAWVQVDVDRGTDPIVPAGTRVQAAALPPARPESLTFEVIDDTQLHGDWGGLTATWVPQPGLPQARVLRFAGDPGLRAGDRALLVAEPRTGATTAVTPLALVKILGATEELGYAVVEFDRDLRSLLNQRNTAYAVYRVLATAGSARHLSKVLRLPAAPPNKPPGPAPVEPGDFLTLPPVAPYGWDTATPPRGWIVLDTALDEVSGGQRVALVDWSPPAVGDVVTVLAQIPVEWEVAPGTPVRVSRLAIGGAGPPTTLSSPRGSTPPPLTAYVLDRRLEVAHVELQTSPQPAAVPQVRLYPAPERMPAWVAVRMAHGGTEGWAVARCRNGLPDGAGGVVVDLPEGIGGVLAVGGWRAPATGNLVRVHHGTSSDATLGSGDASRPGQEMVVPDAPVAYDLDAGGNPVPSMVLRVEGERWDEVPSLYGAGASPSFVTRLNRDGGVTVEFGDGVEGARLPTGTNNVTAAYRVGGGIAGNVADGAIDSLIGSVRGVRKVTGAGLGAGGADQDDARRLRTRAPGRARAFDRAVSSEDIVDLALGYPGITHAAVWMGARPGCACGGAGLHLALLRAAAGGFPRAPEVTELASLAAFLDGRRDTAIALCATGATVKPVALAARLAVDPRRDPGSVVAAARNTLGDVDGPLGWVARSLGQPLVTSRVLVLLHQVPGVVGVSGLSIAAVAPNEAVTPLPYELLAISDVSRVVVAP